MRHPLEHGLDLLRLAWTPVELVTAEVLRTRQGFSGNPERLVANGKARWYAFVDNGHPPESRWPEAAPANLLFGPPSPRSLEIPSILKHREGRDAVIALIETAALEHPQRLPDEVLLLCDKYSVDPHALQIAS